MKIVFCATHVVGVEVLSQLISLDRKPAFIVTTKGDMDGSISGYFDYSNLANEHNIPIYFVKSYNLKSLEDVDFFKKNSFDLIIQGGWQRLFPGDILATLKIGAIGMHGSPNFLPKGRGRSPLNWSLINNENRFIMHMFLIKPGVDDGDVFDTYMFDINQLDDIETLYMKYSIVYKKMLERNLARLESAKLELLPQKGTPSYYSKRSAEDGEIKFETMDVWSIYNLIRAVTRPYPGAFINNFEKNERCIIWKARVLDTRITYPGAEYGKIVETFGTKFVLNCLGGLLLVEEYEYK